MCRICRDPFKSFDEVNEHYSLRHPSKKGPYSSKLKKRESAFECEICDGTYTSMYSLESHMQRVHKCPKKLQLVAISDEKIECEICGKLCKQRKGVLSHMVKIHGIQAAMPLWEPNSEKKLVCDSCGKSYSHRNILAVHMKLEHGRTIP